MKILILDDDKVRGIALEEDIVNSGLADRHDIFLAHDTSEGRRLTASLYFDVIVLDVVLPRRGDGSAAAEYGLEFLRALSRGGKCIKPGRIIGITAHFEDIVLFREKFEESCNTVIEARRGESAWRSRIISAIRYISESKFSKAVTESRVRAITIHGIQTFGDWQYRLKNLVAGIVPGTSFHSYRYGFFSIIAFLIPHVRNREVLILATRLSSLFKEHEGDAKFVIFAHSFGTYLATKALLLLIERNESVPVRTLVLSGSVLPERFSMQRLRQRGIRIVNDCGDNDYVLYLSKAIVPGTGMAGKCGLYGFQDEGIVNRFFPGGHSHYFKGDDFMREYWVPLLSDTDEVKPVDKRRLSFIRHSGLDKVVAGCGFVKHYVYGGLLLAGLSKIAMRLISL